VSYVCASLRAILAEDLSMCAAVLATSVYLSYALLQTTKLDLTAIVSTSVAEFVDQV
jgi:hypothetical protein